MVGSQEDNLYNESSSLNDETAIYAAVNIPLGRSNNVDCSRLYDIALRTKEAELEQLKAQLQLLQQRTKMNSFEE
jgi:hypothetical protein